MSKKQKATITHPSFDKPMEGEVMTDFEMKEDQHDSSKWNVNFKWNFGFSVKDASEALKELFKGLGKLKKHRLPRKLKKKLKKEGKL